MNDLSTSSLRCALVAVLIACATMTTMAQKRLFVFSDPHLLAPGLFQNNSTAFQNDLAGDNKMFDLGNQIMQSMVNTILAERPDAVLIPGDLTKQGAKMSHMVMAEWLQQVVDAGIKVFVIPGNHDVNNTQAVRYDGNNKYPAATVKSSEFVEAARVIGVPEGRIMRRHILPNCLPTLLVLFTLNIPASILTESSLSFLGLGIQPPNASWGLMINTGRQYLYSAPWLCFAPGAAIMLIVLAFNFLGNGLLDVLDPRQRKQ